MLVGLVLVNDIVVLVLPSLVCSLRATSLVCVVHVVLLVWVLNVIESVCHLVSLLSLQIEGRAPLFLLSVVPPFFLRALCPQFIPDLFLDFQGFVLFRL